MISEEYIIQNLEKAVSENWIEVWYQPVIRSLSGNLCGFEALARWRDPVEGLVSPGLFIPVLEKNRMVHLLDQYVIKNVCSKLHSELDAGHTIVPVSFNLSQLDFECCDIIGYLEKISESYDIPRVYLHVEITESLLSGDADIMKTRMDRLQADGFEVWMDDFGSEYSSLNTLKDFDFHTLKIDMKFLSSFSDRSRRIISSIIRMAKEIGVHTLAEGVETFEHYSFLREAGCEKIQGYFFGKPAPYEAAVKNIESQGIRMENRADFSLWSQIGRIDFQTDLPLTIVRDDGTSLVPFFLNAQTKEEFNSLGFTSMEEIQDFFHSCSATASQLRHFVRSLPESGQLRKILLQDDGNYLQIRAYQVALNLNMRVYAINLVNLSKDEKTPEKSVDSLEALLRHTYQLYEHILLLDMVKDRVTTVYGYTPVADMNKDAAVSKNALKNKQESNVARYFSKVSEILIFPDDQSRFAAYTNPDNIREFLKQNPGQSYRDYFRIRMENGSFQWIIISIISMDGSSGKYLAFNRLMSQEAMQNIHEKFSAILDSNSIRYDGSAKSIRSVSKDAITPEAIWSSILRSSGMKLFWKDKERRFAGASQSFLKFYGFQNIDEILGKTDEEVGWHVDQQPYRSDEIKVLTEGQAVLNSPGKCIVRGQLHNILATKFPIYSSGQIIGLVGWFVDSTQEFDSKEEIRTSQSLDPVTGLLNPLSMVLTTRQYVESYDLHQKDFAVIRFRMHGYKRLGRDLGPEKLNQIMKEVGKQLLEKIGSQGVIANYGAGELLALIQTDAPKSVKKYADRICKIVEDIRNVNGTSVTFYVKYNYLWYHESKNVLEFQKMINSLKVK
ncbi:MAG: EAL domain-containing protein [Eubacterium sp.]|nr:EAL domain-containing protein [Eubacterium sp.]